MQQTEISQFITLARQYPVLDVRSPGEYGHAHIPGAYSLPLFSDDERKVVGTLYKQEGRAQAIKKGLEYFGVKMRPIVEDVEAIIEKHNAPDSNPDSQSRNPNSKLPTSFCHREPAESAILVHCWRGGMRSAGVAWLLGLYGFKVQVLAGGYKAYRNWVLQQFEKDYPFRIVGGYTGSGKTGLLKEMAASKHTIIDLEGTARHKGSAFGALGEETQPGQEQFENLLAMELHHISACLPAGAPVWLEDESRRIGLVNLPDALWQTMQRSPIYFMDVPFEERLDYITAGYGKFKKEELVTAVMRIQKRLGGLNAKTAINYLLEDNCKECFRILLGYYDKFYKRDFDNRKKEVPVKMIPCEGVNAKENYRKLIGEN